MAGITAAQAQAKLDLYLAAEDALVAGNQAYAVGDRSFTKADLAEIRKAIEYWDCRAKDLASQSSGAGRSRSPSAGW